MPPARKWIEISTSACLALGILTAMTLYLIVAASPLEAAKQFFLNRGFIQPVITSIACVVIYYCLLRRIKIRKETASASKNWILEDIDLSTQRVRSARESLKLLNQSKSIAANRQARILYFFLKSNSRTVARELQKDDAEACQIDIDNAYLVVRTMIWMMPMLGFLGTVLGISVSISGFSGLLTGISNLTTVKVGLSRVTTGLSTAFDTTLLGIVGAISCMLLLSICEKDEYDFALKVEAKVSDSLASKLAATNERL